MKAFLIDPKAFTVQPVDLKPGDTLLPQIYKHLQCDVFTCVGMERGDTVYVDDNGLATGSPYHFIVDGYPQPLVGRGLVLGSDDEGESTDARISLDALKARITFMHYFVPGIVTLRPAAQPRRFRLVVLRDLLNKLAASVPPG